MIRINYYVYINSESRESRVGQKEMGGEKKNLWSLERLDYENQDGNLKL